MGAKGAFDLIPEPKSLSKQEARSHKKFLESCSGIFSLKVLNPILRNVSTLVDVLVVFDALFEGGVDSAIVLAHDCILFIGTPFVVGPL
jgi:hypothetical protein